MHGLTDSGIVDVLATAPGCIGKTFKVTLVPSGFIVSNLSSINTTTFSTPTILTIRPYRLNPTTLAYVQNQRIRGDITVHVPITSSYTNVGIITATPLIFTGGVLCRETGFKPVGGGSCNITVEVPPASLPLLLRELYLSQLLHLTSIPIQPTSL